MPDERISCPVLRRRLNRMYHEHITPSPLSFVHIKRSRASQPFSFLFSHSIAPPVYIRAQPVHLTTSFKMATPTAAVRYSQTKTEMTDQAKAFPWECPIPATPFWEALTFVEARNFLQSFASDEERAALPIDRDSTAPKDEKLELLSGLLDNKLAAEDAAVAPQTWYDVDFKAWNRLQMGRFTLQQSLGRDVEAEGTLRMMIGREKNKNNLSFQHTLAALLCDQGKYREAEEMEGPVVEWLDGILGRDSPQALGGRRIMARAMWKQGEERREDARKLFEEVMETVEGMGGGQFAVYQEEERELVRKMVKDLEDGRL